MSRSEEVAVGPVAAYARRAQEYSDLLGSVDQMEREDRRRIEDWADGVPSADGEGEFCAPEILDLGCGPGHWSAHLAARGHRVLGIDPAEEFVALARERHPEVPFATGSAEDLQASAGRFDGILAWYSLIHCPPHTLPGLLATVRGALRPRGTLLLGFFTGERIAPFDHAVTTAWTWPMPEVRRMLFEEGFTVVDSQARVIVPGASDGDLDRRVHGDVWAQRR